ncbi:hypothetical protein MKX01_024572 [Papaver californicum]|nr:hypothetical protein MKX01_024572 [Papaver californicum]
MKLSKMKKWSGVVLIASLFMLLVLRYGIITGPIVRSPISNTFLNSANPLEWLNTGYQPAIKNPESNTHVPTDVLVTSLFTPKNFSEEEQKSLKTWTYLSQLIGNVGVLPNAVEAIKEAKVAWDSLMTLVQEEKLSSTNESSQLKMKEKQCPPFLDKMNAMEFGDSGYKLRIPCGLVQGSSVTIIGIPIGILGNFRIDLTGSPLPGEPDPPVVLHFNVRLHGDKITDDPVIVQNTWTLAHDWGEEERYPSPVSDNNKTVNGLHMCNEMVGKNDTQRFMDNKNYNSSRRSSMAHDRFKPEQFFPFKQGHLSVATLRVGVEGLQMMENTYFLLVTSLEPWLVSEVRISGDLKLVSVLAGGLPISKDLDHIVDLEVLRAPPLPSKSLDLFIGVFSTANNFKRRMAVRRLWMQYDAVRSGVVAVRFFVGLHKNQIVNEELWNEARTYGDTQLMPFVDYYSLITWKTLAICIFETEVVSAKYVMKTDDDAFVCVDEVLSSLNRISVTQGLLYSLINSDSHPHRDNDSKWYISPEEWPEESYPPWAHGPGYVVSSDIVKTVYNSHTKGQLKMFKLEDVAMGFWIAEMKKKGLNIKYEQDERIHNEGCKDRYVVAHHQAPRELLCLWEMLQEHKQTICCGER